MTNENNSNNYTTGIDRWIERRERSLEGNPTEYARGYESALNDLRGRLSHHTWDLRNHFGLPEIVCLCGSTRFKDEYRTENARLTLDGKIILSVGFFHHSGDAPEGVSEQVERYENSDIKADLDALHKRKIDLADRIHVVNVDGYVDESTKFEIEYAARNGKKISWLEPENAYDVTPDTNQDK